MSLTSINAQLFINNEFVDSKSGETFDTIDPSTEEVLAKMQRANKDDVDIAVSAATNAFTTWRDVSGPDRRDLLLKLADLMEENQQFLAEWESKDNGKPVSVARDIDIALGIKHLRYFAGWADKIQGKTIPTENVNSMAMTIHEPIGVVGCIIPWNFPIVMMMWKLGPLLACGCTTVLKSSEKTPITALLIAQLIKEAGFPAGVVNVLSGYGPDCGNAIAVHPDVDKVAFTGSSAVGHEIVKSSGASNLKKVTLELGGKSALIVCEDADLDQAADTAHVGLFLNHGQCCCASSRILVDAKIHDAFVQKCIERAKKQKLGTSEGMDQGPQVDKVQYDKVMDYIESGKKEGATCEIGGKRHGDKGYYIEPTVFTNVTDDMKIAKEEIFGPVMQLMKFDTIEEAIIRANSSHYGLAAGVCSTNIATAMGIARRLKAGTVWINMYDDFDAAIPFGGYKQSGWGREKGEYALENFTEVKLIQFPINNY
jgi:aldehyde dehydrogenase (NAD+)|eukprot:657_1